MSQPNIDSDTNIQLNQNDANVENFIYQMNQHEENIELLNSLLIHSTESVLDLQASLGRYNMITSQNENGAFPTEDKTMKRILKKDNSTALGVLATLAKVENDNLSRILSEYVGLEMMLAIVCSTNEEVKTLETYDPGLHGLGSSTGKTINGRFAVICLEYLRPFVGGFVEEDPQKKLAIPKPKLPNGECPPGFLDFAVNMVHLDSNRLSFLTATGHGLRETLFYSLFSHLQIYETRKEMLLALPCITDGALSLDGGMIRKCGIFACGGRNDVEVKFPLIDRESDVPPNYNEVEDMVRKLKI